MRDWRGDVVILGAGFGGSLLGLILKQIGLRVLLVDRGAHPRFAIGESSTPVANSLWTELTEQYDLPRLRPLAKYGTWQRDLPQIPCGLKRGFSYVDHTPGQLFHPTDDHHNVLLVAASHGVEDADTHWLRADFDAFIAAEAVAHDIPLWERTQITEVQQSDRGWSLRGVQAEQPVEIQAGFLIDATGEGQLLSRNLQLRNRVQEYHTHSRAVFAHFRNLPPWEAVLDHPACYRAHPYPIDDAALHQLFPEGWMWQLPFNNGVTSAGFSVQRDFRDGLGDLTPAQEFAAWAERLPTVAQQFLDAEVCNSAGIIRSQRLQRWLAPASGQNWAMLPTTAVFLDPLHSTGNAHTLSGIQRLARMFAQHGTDWHSPAAQAELATYDRLLQLEAAHIDRIVHAGFHSLGDFPLFCAGASFYFLAAIWSEHLHRTGQWNPDDGFLLANHPEFSRLIQELHRDLVAVRNPAVPVDDRRRFLDTMRERIAPYNLAGLLDPVRRNLYPYPKD